MMSVFSIFLFLVFSPLVFFYFSRSLRSRGGFGILNSRAYLNRRATVYVGGRGGIVRRVLERTAVAQSGSKKKVESKSKSKSKQIPNNNVPWRAFTNLHRGAHCTIDAE